MRFVHYTVLSVEPHEVRRDDAFVGMADRPVARISQQHARWFFHDRDGRLIRTCGIASKVQVFRRQDCDYCDPYGTPRPIFN